MTIKIKLSLVCHNVFIPIFADINIYLGVVTTSHLLHKQIPEIATFDYEQPEVRDRCG